MPDRLRTHADSWKGKPWPGSWSPTTTSTSASSWSSSCRRSGTRSSPSSDGAAAIDACQAQRPDLAVLDVMMPGVSGLDAIRAIRADPALADLPVILLTARAQESDVETGFDSGADDYITKPFSPRELASRVQALLLALPSHDRDPPVTRGIRRELGVTCGARGSARCAQHEQRTTGGPAWSRP